MTRAILKRLRRDERGMTILEFAFLAPVLLVSLLGFFDMAYREYISSVLQGEVQKAGRDSTLPNGATAGSSLDARVRNRVSVIIPDATWTFSRLKYASFTRAGQAENFTDTNANGLRDAGECFQDENANNTWDADAGASGQGGSKDIVVYKAQLSYPRVFPMAGLLGWNPNQVIAATTVLRNQPFGTQTATAVTVICT
jgi:Flp pilus assembly protein TadG